MMRLGLLAVVSLVVLGSLGACSHPEQVKCTSTELQYANLCIGPIGATRACAQAIECASLVDATYAERRKVEAAVAAISDGDYARITSPAACASILQPYLDGEVCQTLALHEEPKDVQEYAAPREPLVCAGTGSAQCSNDFYGNPYQASEGTNGYFQVSGRTCCPGLRCNAIEPAPYSFAGTCTPCMEVKRQGTPPGALTQCKTSDDCCSGVCKSGSCESIGVGDSCQNDRECGGRSCRGGTCQPDAAPTPTPPPPSSSSSGSGGGGGCNDHPKCTADSDCGSCQRCVRCSGSCVARLTCARPDQTD